MTHFPHKFVPRSSLRSTSGTEVPSKPGSLRDLMWGRPVFKAPDLNPRPAFDSVPFTLAHVPSITRRAEIRRA